MVKDIQKRALECEHELYGLHDKIVQPSCNSCGHSVPLDVVVRLQLIDTCKHCGLGVIQIMELGGRIINKRWQIYEVSKTLGEGI